ncbi:MAG: hypothetical protein ACK52I_37470 [Pseudomonadota bacterium]|jgi:hypothetical protein
MNGLNLNEARANAYQYSRLLATMTGAEKIVEFRQVSATDFVYGERGTLEQHGALVGAFQNGKAVA